MLKFQQENQFFIFNFDQAKANQHQFFDPQFWQQEQRIAGSAKGRGITYFLNTLDLFGLNTVLRHYYRGGLMGKLNKDRYCFSSLDNSRSFAEFHLLNELHSQGIPVPKAIGARICKTPLGGYRADILTQKIDQAEDLTALLQHRCLPEHLWQQIGKLIHQLHQQQICHTDLNAHNILVQQNERCWLIDFDKCGKKAGEVWKEENLQRLHRSFIKEKSRMNIRFSPQNWQNLLAGYYESK